MLGPHSFRAYNSPPVNEIPKILLALLMSLVLILVLGEIGTRLYTAVFTFYDIEMSRYANELKISSPNPKIGHVHRPNSSAHLMDVDVQINSDGLRDREYPVARSAKHRIAVLGDSLTFAWGVAQQDSFENLLEESLNRLRPTEVINFGTGNYNTEQQVNLFLDKGLKYQPDQIVIFYFINDAEPTPTRSDWGFLSHSRLVTLFWSRLHAALTNVSASVSYKDFYAQLYRDDQPGWIHTQQAFLEIRDVALKQGIDLRVVLLPDFHDLVDYPLAEQHAKLQRFLAQAGIPSLDLVTFLSDERDPYRLWVAMDDAHPNAEAHRLIARHALDFISGPGEGNGRVAN